MGADGHIAIYDWTKTVGQFPELKTDEWLRELVVGTAYIYNNPVGEGKWLVAYWGDNLWEPTFPGYELPWYENKAHEEVLNKAKEIVKWMNDYAVIVDDWEVWT